jgi:hypothetical protein
MPLTVREALSRLPVKMAERVAQYATQYIRSPNTKTAPHPFRHGAGCSVQVVTANTCRR